MKPDSTHINVILDRSGSMGPIREDTIGGYNTFLAEQKAQPGAATWTLVQFDSQDPYEVVHGFKPIAEILALDPQTYVPRGGTPLFDALGRGINDVEQNLGKLPESERPAKVIFAIVTDGEENASTEFSGEQVQKMIKEKTEASHWEFVFLSSDLAAIQEAESLGMQAPSMMRFARSAAGTAGAWSALSRRSSEYRSGRKMKIGFAQEDRDSAADPGKKKA